MKRLIDVLASGVKDSTGDPVSNGQVYFYEGGTTTLQTAYQDWELTQPHANPASLDGAGCLTAYVEGRVRLVIADENGAAVRTIDQVGTSDEDIGTAAVNIAAGDGILVGADDSLSVNIDGSTLTIDAENQVRVGTQGISATELLDHGVTGVKLNSDCVDGTSLEYSSNIISVKADGITRDKQADLDVESSAVISTASLVNASFTDIAGATVTVTSVGGRPIMLLVQPDPTSVTAPSGTTEGGITVNKAANAANVRLRWVRGATPIALFSLGGGATGATAVSYTSGTPLLYVDIGNAPGTYTYKLQYQSISSGGVLLDKMSVQGFEL